ncbi:RluA family pseudouridine synthase [Loigolactobacillus iwatensis]|uniref:RluA family pseudouridine synthase n=1 Tax=Loigolactobacillus iwatensis TaxID=1267156 RepID=UPI000F7EE093|nr:RluA family pseudouridine synthase [Loigolactobacillus iwatensis]
MIFNWTFTGKDPQKVKYFLNRQGISRTLLKKIKYHGGAIKVNDQDVTVLYLLQSGDRLTVLLPAEEPLERIVPSALPITVVYEDTHFLVVDKPAQVASLPAHLYPLDTMANRVKGYYLRQGYSNQVIHIVTRLDRGTSGLMLFAKHSYAHAVLDQELQHHQLHKTYLAFVAGQLVHDHQMITFPIQRQAGSFIKRTTGASGREAQTEYWCVRRFRNATLVKVQLHTGRTHQIRVHFTAIGHPLLGDHLYGGPKIGALERPALHCQQLRFYHPFLKREIKLTSTMPSDLMALEKFLAKQSN